jgi:cytoskeleton protein RodZ
MSDPATTGESAAAEAASVTARGPEAAGAALLRERRRQGLSLGDISRQLKLSVRQVEALERDDYSGYKGPVFIHGFIRNYAKLLGLDPDPLIRATDSMLNPPAVPVAAPREPDRPRPVRAEQRKSRLWPAIVTVLVIGIAMSVYFGGRRAPDGGRSAPSVATRDKTASVPRAPVEAKTVVETKPGAEPKKETEVAVKPAAKPEKKPEVKEVKEVKTEPKSNTAEQRAPADTGGAIAADAAGRMVVRMQFEQDSWVEIKDRNGNTIFGQLNPAGSRRSARGEPPLTIVIGNAAGVRLFQGDKSIDLAPYTRVDVARLTLE